jgi:hypothetical protein
MGQNESNGNEVKINDRAICRQGVHGRILWTYHSRASVMEVANRVSKVSDGVRNVKAAAEGNYPSSHG